MSSTDGSRFSDTQITHFTNGGHAHASAPGNDDMTYEFLRFNRGDESETASVEDTYAVPSEYQTEGSGERVARTWDFRTFTTAHFCAVLKINSKAKVPSFAKPSGRAHSEYQAYRLRSVGSAWSLNHMLWLICVILRQIIGPLVCSPSSLACQPAVSGSDCPSPCPPLKTDKDLAVTPTRSCTRIWLRPCDAAYPRCIRSVPDEEPSLEVYAC